MSRIAQRRQTGSPPQGPPGNRHAPRAARLRPARAAALGLILMLPALTGRAQATLLEPLSLGDLTRRADVVLRGRVDAVQTRSLGPQRMPVTFASVEVLELLAGDLPPRRQVLVTQPGGRADGVELDYAGRPRFTAGEEIVLFLEQRAPGQFITLGLAQGKFQVAPADGDGRRAVYRDLRGAAFSRPQAEPPPADLAALRHRVRQQARDLAGSRP